MTSMECIACDSGDSLLSGDENDGYSVQSDDENDDSSLDFCFTWKIQNFSLCSHKNGEVLESPVINERFNGQWIVELYPKGFKKEDEGFISLYLRKKNDDKYSKLNDVTFYASIINENCVCIKTERKRKMFQNNVGERLGWRKFMEIYELEEALANFEDDILKFQCFMRCKRHNLRPSTPEAYTEVGVDKNTFLWNLRIPDSQIVSSTEFAFSESLHLGICASWDNGEFLISIYQKPMEPFITCFIRCKLSLKGAKGDILKSETDNHLFKRNGKDEVWRFPRFLTSMAIYLNRNSFVKKNTITLCFEFSVSNGSVSSKVLDDLVSNESTCLVLQDDIKNMFLNRIHSDVKLKTGNKILYAHKSVLSARSPVFFAMFDHQDMMESKTGTVDISDADAYTLESFLEFIYTGKVEMRDYSKVKNLLLIANKYQVQSLREKCVSFLKLSLSLLNACEMLIVADLIGHQLLKRVTMDFIAMNSATIFNMPEWLELVKKHIKLAGEVFSNIGANFSLIPNNSSACINDSWYQEREKKKRKTFSD